MKTKMIWANLASTDLEKTVKFYTDLGFKENCQRTEELVSIVFADNHTEKIGKYDLTNSMTYYQQLKGIKNEQQFAI